MTDTTKLRELLAPDIPGPWIYHDSGGRPHPPGTFIEIECRDGLTQLGESAFYDFVRHEDEPEASDIMRWRPRKRMPSDQEIAAEVPALLDELDRLREALRQANVIAESIGIIASGCASTHGDPGGGLEMINGYAEDLFRATMQEPRS